MKKTEPKDNFDLDKEFDKMMFGMEAELMERGFLHANGTVKTFKNAHEERMPEGTFH